MERRCGQVARDILPAGQPLAFQGEPDCRGVLHGARASDQSYRGSLANVTPRAADNDELVSADQLLAPLDMMRPISMSFRALEFAVARTDSLLISSHRSGSASNGRSLFNRLRRITAAIRSLSLCGLAERSTLRRKRSLSHSGLAVRIDLDQRGLHLPWSIIFNWGTGRQGHATNHGGD